MALKALVIDKKFWFTYETGGEGLLFRRADFEHPWQSPLLQEMETIAALNRDVRQFRQVCMMDVHNVPRLEEFASGLSLDLFGSIDDAGSVEPERTIYLDAQKKYLFLSRLGEIVTVVGKIEEIFSGKTRDDVPHVFFNFGNWKIKCFTVVLWDEALSLMQTTGIDPQEYRDKWVSVTGMLTSYKRRPQMIVNTPFDIEILDEERVNQKIAASSPFWFVRKTAPIASPGKKMVVPKPQQIEKLPVKKVTVVQTSRPQNIVDNNHPTIDLDAQVANPLDINNSVVGKINDLYKNLKPVTRAAKRKKKAQ
jgi:DNA/RNA endonuclease YhcR with UshA esterase domain